MNILIFAIFSLIFQFQSLGRQHWEVTRAKLGGWMLFSAYLTPIGTLFRAKPAKHSCFLHDNACRDTTPSGFGTYGSKGPT